MEKDFSLSNPKQINRIIQSLRDDHQLVGVNFGEPGKGSQSIILDIDTEDGFFTVDEFPSSECHRLATTGKTFDLKAELNGIDVNMPGLSVEDVREDEEGSLYRVAIPKRISYAQRREAFRARVSGLMTVPVNVAIVADEQEGTGVETEIHEATLSDISAEGCRLSIPGTEVCPFDTIGLVLSLSIHVPDDDPIQVIAETRHQRFLSRSKLWFIGCRFHTDVAEVRSRIERFVIHMQRLERQKSAMFD